MSSRGRKIQKDKMQPEMTFPLGIVGDTEKSIRATCFVSVVVSTQGEDKVARSPT